MKNVTMNDIANSLNVSRITVWKALNGHTGVSATLRLKIQEKASEMGYLHPKPAAMVGPAPRPAVSIVVARPKSSLFWINIIHGIAEEFSKTGFNLIYSYMPSAYTTGCELPAALTDGSVQGIIVLNVYDYKLIEMLNGLDIPKVFLDVVTNFPQSELTGDLVLLDGRASVYDITRRLIQKNLTSVGFIGDIAYALTNRMRYDGYLDAHKNSSLVPDPRFSLTEPLGIYNYYEQISAFLDGLGTLPRSFVCVSDHTAHIVKRCLDERGVRVPEDIVLTGFDGHMEYPNVSGLTTARIDTDSLGGRLAWQLRFRAAYPLSPPETIHISPDVSWSDYLL